MGNVSSDPSKRVQWMWNAGTDPFSKSELTDWRPYSDVENLIIEEAFLAGKTRATLDNYHIDVKHNLQISDNDNSKQRLIKRVVGNRDDKRLRAERFTSNPVAPDHLYGGFYGFISPFIKEVVKDLNLTREKLPSKNKKVVPMIVEKAAQGIIEEGKMIGKQREAEEMAKHLMKKRKAGRKEIWKCCAHLYSLESFLYKILNQTMRSIGSKDHEHVWRSKVGTLGPFCLLLWDNPFNNKIAKPGTIIYRGAELSDDFIATFKDDCSKVPKPFRSFQTFTSCTRNRNKAENSGNANVLFIMKLQLAFTVNLTKLSEYPHEEEELLFPGVCFTIDQVEFDRNTNKHLIYITLQHRHDSQLQPDKNHISKSSKQSTEQNTTSYDDRAYADFVAYAVAYAARARAYADTTYADCDAPDADFCAFGAARAYIDTDTRNDDFAAYSAASADFRAYTAVRAYFDPDTRNCADRRAYADYCAYHTGGDAYCPDDFAYADFRRDGNDSDWK